MSLKANSGVTAGVTPVAMLTKVGLPARINGFTVINKDTEDALVIIRVRSPFNSSTYRLIRAVTLSKGVLATGLLTITGQPQNVAATGILTLAANAANTEIVTIDTKVYTFQTSLTDVDGNVKIGASASASIDNLIAAITLGAGAGTTYAASMTEHPTVTSAAGAGDTLDATAKVAGSAGNSIVTTEGMGNGSWGAGNLAGGITDTVTIDGKVYTFQTVLTEADGNTLIAATAALTRDNLLNAINDSGGTKGTDYATANVVDAHVDAVVNGDNIDVNAKFMGAGANKITTTEAAANMSFGAGVLAGGVDPSVLEHNTPIGLKDNDSLEIVLVRAVLTTELDWTVSYDE